MGQEATDIATDIGTAQADVQAGRPKPGRLPGELNGRADLDTSGNSVAALLGSADGELKLPMNDGAISRNLLEAAGLKVGNIILGKPFGDRTVEISCAATDLKATDGLFRTQLFVFGTIRVRHHSCSAPRMR